MTLKPVDGDGFNPSVELTILQVRGTACRHKKSRHGDGFSVWWRRRESNPRPQVLRHRLYMLIHAFCFNRQQPDGRGKLTAIPVRF